MREPLVVEITDRQSAEGQLETAIALWFLEKDLSSIHTLAGAAQGVLHKMCSEKDESPSQIRKIIKNDPTKKILLESQYFFKHGTDRNAKRKGVMRHVPMMTEEILIDCISMHVRLFDTLSALMKLFGFRYNLFNPKAFPMKMTVKGIKVEDLRRLGRREFLKEVLPRLRFQIGQVTPAS
jgi:hypothetical protein